MDFDRYKRLEYIRHNWQIGNTHNLIMYLESLGLIYKNEEGKHDSVLDERFLFKCDDDVERVVFVEYNNEYYLLLEFWIKLVVVNGKRNNNIEFKIRNKKF